MECSIAHLKTMSDPIFSEIFSQFDDNDNDDNDDAENKVILNTYFIKQRSWYVVLSGCTTSELKVAGLILPPSVLVEDNWMTVDP